MCDLEGRLDRCFAAVFTWLTPDEIRNLEAGNSEVWDSLSAVLLASVIQEEFEVEIDPEALPALNSFASFRNYLNELQPVDGGGPA